MSITPDPKVKKEGATSTPRQTILRALGAVFFGSGDDLAYYRLHVFLAVSAAFAIGVCVTLFTTPKPAVALMWALSCFMIGNGFGFLFGIPKTAQLGGATRSGQSEAPNQKAASGEGADQTSQPYRQYVNTNLEDISDWLTKIIVGVTLIELRQIVEYFNAASATCASGLSDTPGGKELSAANAIIGYFFAFGAGHGYVYTRMILAGAFRLADEFALARIEREVAQVQVRVGELSEQVMAVNREVKDQLSLRDEARAERVPAPATSPPAAQTQNPQAASQNVDGTGAGETGPAAQTQEPPAASPNNAEEQ